MATIAYGTLRVEFEIGEPVDMPLESDVVTFGRAADNDIVIDDQRVSRHHAKLVRENGRLVLSDLGSSNGTWINGERITEQEITSGVTFSIGSHPITLKGVKAQAAPAAPPPAAVSGATMQMAFSADAAGLQAERLQLDKPIVTLGRDASCDMVLDHPAVSRLHAQIRKEGEDFYIIDLKSTNGTYVNSEAVQVKRKLQPNDEIRIASYRIVFDGNTIAPTDETGNVRLDVIHIKKVVGKGMVLLNDISLSILPREFVAVVGVSGAGKSTLLDALNGFRPATEGSVLANGANLYESYDAFRSQIGYVPQEDIIHRELTANEALDYAAQLRMPADTTPAERKKRVAEVLESLGLTAAKDRVIGRLSGGQRKRVSIGVELLTRPSLFFLDEATSGLDPGTESQMMQLLAKLADQGHTIILITHATKNVMLCDQVVFLAKGGNLAFYGPPAEALAYFGVKDFDEIYTKLEQELSPQEWGERYKNSPQYRKYVMGRLREAVRSVPYVPAPAGATRGKARPAAKGTSAFTQLRILSRRSIAILLRDRASLVLMLLIAPIIGSIDLITWRHGLFDTQGGDAGQALTMLFMMSLICVLVGSIASMREIVKEADVYRRERMVTLKIAPYVLSKVWLGVLLALYQAAVFIVSKQLGAGWPNTPATIGQTYVTLVLTIVCGMLLGLFISAASPNQNVAPLLLIIVLVAQFMFSGGLLPLSNLGAAGKALSQITTAKWSYEALVTVSKLGADVAGDACWQMTKEERDALTDAQKAACTCMGANVFKTCAFPGVLDKYDAAVDQPEPAEPKAPGDPPAQPVQPTPPAAQTAEAQQAFQQASQRFQGEMVSYQKDMEAYQVAAKKYQDDVSAWRNQYLDWKAKHDKAISGAEGTINKVNEDFSSTFKVNLMEHWAWLGGISLVLFGLIMVVQKRKDVV